ncbi:synapse differentiation-inducing gene protein 1-like [Terrapene carolina triunguis]|uniref:synapse differentiation-inducing gene protein 1-like n=1 Tax=Terrapene triunguis TaxID=2587831 RepID=UPI000CEFC1F3|nr:synapse differentiation-inducing gene protein 1-like [Terrapene carolina triunguis]
MDPPSSLPYARLEIPDLDSVPSYKYWSIFNILCCCLPLGLVAVFYSGQVEECLARRDIAGAKTASDTARAINILAVVIGLGCIGVTIFFMIQRVQLLQAAQPTQSPLYYNLG